MDNCLRCNPKNIGPESPLYDPAYFGHYVQNGRPKRTCDACGAQEGRRVMRRLHPTIGGKRGRNSGKVKNHSKR